MDKRIGKKLLKNEKAIEVLEDALEVGLLNQGYYIIGFPWDNEASIARDGEMAKICDI